MKPRGTILIVDSEPNWRAFSQKTLTGDGYEVDTASEVRDALWLVFGECYDLIVISSDLLRPEENDSLKNVVERCREKQVVIMSDPYLSRIRELSESKTAFKLGTKWIRKPLAKRTLLETVHGLMKAGDQEPH